MSGSAGRIGQEGLISARELPGHPAGGEHCIVHHCFSEVLLLSLLFVAVVVNIILCISYGTVLNPGVLFFFLILLSFPQESEQVSHVILNCQMGLNHNIWEGIHKSQGV